MLFRRLTCVFLCLIVLFCALPVMADTAVPRVSFSAERYTCVSGTTAKIQIRLSAKQAEDLTVTVKDSRDKTYQVTVPAGKTKATLKVKTARSGSNSRISYTITGSPRYSRANPFTCELTVTAVAFYTFSSHVIQTTTGQKINVRLNISHPETLEEGTEVSLYDKDGVILSSFHHAAKATSKVFSFTMDEDWQRGKHLYVRVSGRNEPDSDAYVAVRIPGSYSIYGVKRNDKKIAFTMDCGSASHNVKTILNILDEYGLKITFFVTGQFAKNNRALVKEMHARGHEIANHSWSHPSFFKLSPDQMLDQLNRTSTLLEDITGQPIRYFRPPYGDMNEAVRAVVHAAGYEVIRWTHSTGDSGDDATEARSFHGATDKLQGGSIILSHVDSDATTAALPRILDYYRDNGFEVVPVSDLLLPEPTQVDGQGLQYAL